MDKSIYTEEHKALVEKLIEARLSSGLTQKEVAKKLKATQSYVSKLESGQRKIDLIVLKRFADIYRKKIGYFL